MIFVECKPDFSLARLFVQRKEIKHAGNKSEGIIDEDPGKPYPSLFQNFSLKNSFDDAKIKIYEAKNGSKLILLSPMLEKWIIDAAKESKVNIKKFNLPEDENELHEIINANIKRFEMLLKELISKSTRLNCLKGELLKP